MKVLHVLPSLNIGGAERLVIDIVRCFKEFKNVSSDLCILYNSYNESLMNEANSVSNEVSVLSNRKRHGGISLIWPLVKLINFNAYDIVHSHCINPSVVVGLSKPFTKKFYHVFTLHDTRILTKAHPIKQFILRKTADKVICISNVVKEEFDALRFNNSIVIKNGIDLSKFQKTRNKPQYRDIFRLVTVARLDIYKKGLDLLVQAISKCKKEGVNIDLDIIGPGELEEIQKLNELIHLYGVEKSIHLLGPRTDINEILGNYDLFILPSRYEGFGLVIIEAMSAGVPVLASNIDGPSEIISNNKDGFLFESEDVNSLTQQIIRLSKDEKLRNTVKDSALRKSLEYSIEKMCEQYYGVYNQLITSARVRKQWI